MPPRGTHTKTAEPIQAHSDSIEFICAIQKTLMYVCMYVCMYPDAVWVNDSGGL